MRLFRLKTCGNYDPVLWLMATLNMVRFTCCVLCMVTVSLLTLRWFLQRLRLPGPLLATISSSCCSWFRVVRFVVERWTLVFSWAQNCGDRVVT